MSLLVMALADLGVEAAVLHREPGRHHHRHRPHPGQDPGGQGRPAARGAGRRARCRWWPGSRASRRARDHHARTRRAPTPPPWRWPPSSTPTSARSTPTSPACSPPTPASCPRRTASTGSRSTRCSRWRRRAGRVLMLRAVEFARNHNVPLHVRSSFTWEPGTWVVEEDADMEEAVVTAVTHDTSEAKVTVSGVPDRPGVAARLFRALADKSINVDMIVQNTSAHGTTDISFTVPKADLPGGGRDGPGPRRRAGRLRGDRRRRRRPGLAHRRRHEVAPGHRRHHVRDAGQRGDQHRHDLDLDHPDLVHRGARTTSSGPCAACTRPSPWADGDQAAGQPHAVAAPSRQDGDRPAPRRVRLRPRAGPAGPPRRHRARAPLRRARRRAGPRPEGRPAAGGGAGVAGRPHDSHGRARAGGDGRAAGAPLRGGPLRGRARRRCSTSCAPCPTTSRRPWSSATTRRAHASRTGLLAPRDKKGLALAVQHGFPTCALGVYRFNVETGRTWQPARPSWSR